MAIYTNRKGTLRLYDGTGTAYYLELDFDSGDISGPLGQPLTEEILILHRGTMDSDAHYIEGSDEALMEPVDFSFSAMLEDTSHTAYLINWLKAMNDGGTTTVNSNTLVSTKSDTQRDGSNNNPAFADSNKFTCNAEYLLDGSNDVLFQYNEILFQLNDQTVDESDDGVNVSLTGKTYGTIVVTPGGSFSSGTDVTT